MSEPSTMRLGRARGGMSARGEPIAWAGRLAHARCGIAPPT